MYICICNAINEEQVEDARLDGIATPDELVKKCGKQLQCYKCVKYMQRILDGLEGK